MLNYKIKQINLTEIVEVGEIKKLCEIINLC